MSDWIVSWARRPWFWDQEGTSSSVRRRKTRSVRGERRLSVWTLKLIDSRNTKRTRVQYLTQNRTRAASRDHNASSRAGVSVPPAPRGDYNVSNYEDTTILMSRH